MVKTYKRGRDAQTGRFITVKEAKERPSKAVVETVKVGKSFKSTEKRTIKTAPKSGNISRTAIQNAVKTVSSARKK